MSIEVNVARKGCVVRSRRQRAPGDGAECINVACNVGTSAMNLSVVVCIKDRLGNRPSCAGAGGVDLAERLEREFAARGMEVGVKRLLCFGRCEEGPNLRIAPGGAFFTRMTEERLGEVIAAVESLLANPDTPEQGDQPPA